MIVDPGGSYFLTWLRTPDPTPTERAPLEADWRRTDGALWGIDFVWMPGTDGLAASRACARELISRGVAADGEIVYLWRNKARRRGWFRARS